MKKVFIAGGTGFIGGYITEALLKIGLAPVVLVRPQKANQIVLPPGCLMRIGDVLDRESLVAALSDCEAVIYSVGLLRENLFRGITFQKLHVDGLVNCVDAAVENGVKRFLLVSAQGVKPHGTPYQTSKYLGEQYLKQQPLDWTIFRPSLVFGNPRGRTEFTTQLYRQIVRPLLPAPMFFRGFQLKNAGDFSFTPVFVEDLATVIVRTLMRKEDFSPTIPIGGPDELTWREIVHIIAKTVGRKKWAIPVPVWGLWPILMLFNQLPFFPVTKDQLAMLLEGNVASTDIFKELNVNPTPFAVTTLGFLKDQR
jgi:NADH dehydrogenase